MESVGLAEKAANLEVGDQITNLARVSALTRKADRHNYAA